MLLEDFVASSLLVSADQPMMLPHVEGFHKRPLGVNES
jgi:hypothetical protein